MLKVRVIPTLLHKDFGLVKGVKFDPGRRVGPATQAIKVYNLREVDEIAFLDVSATLGGRRPDFRLIDELADECFVPLTVGGGVTTVDDIAELLAVGADKVAIGSTLFATPEIVRAGADRFGAQCIVASLDVRREDSGRCELYSHCGTRPTGRDPVTFAKELEQLGAGEILLTSIDRDGTMRGYDLALVAEVARAVSIPVIASGGAGTYDHLAEAITEGGAAAVAAASIWHFTEMTPMAAKRHMATLGIPVRL